MISISLFTHLCPAAGAGVPADLDVAPGAVIEPARLAVAGHGVRVVGKVGVLDARLGPGGVLAEAEVADVVGAGALAVLHADLPHVAEAVAAVGPDGAALVHLFPT